MGFPILYAGLLPRLLFTAAMSMEALKDICASLLERLGISSHNPADPYNQLFSSQHHQHHPRALTNYGPFSPHPQHYDWYFNPHLYTPFDPRLLLCHSAFSEAVRASLPVMLYKSFNGELPSSSSSSSLSSLPSMFASVSPSPSPASVPLISSAQAKLQQHNVSALLCPPTSCAATSSPSTTLTSASPCSSPSYTMPLASPALQSKASAYMLQLDAHDNELTELQASLQPPSQTVALDHGDHFTECIICLCEFQGEQEVRELPECSHIFHKHCIDGWILHNHYSCPLCRSSLLMPAVVLQEMLREQSELSLQLNSWLSSQVQEREETYPHDQYAQEREETYPQDQHAQHHHHHQHQTFFFTLEEPTGHETLTAGS